MKLTIWRHLNPLKSVRLAIHTLRLPCTDTNINVVLDLKQTGLLCVWSALQLCCPGNLWPINNAEPLLALNYAPVARVLIHAEHGVKKGGFWGGVNEEIVRKKETTLPHGIHTHYPIKLRIMHVLFFLGQNKKLCFEYLATLSTKAPGNHKVLYFPLKLAIWGQGSSMWTLNFEPPPPGIKTVQHLV